MRGNEAQQDGDAARTTVRDKKQAKNTDRQRTTHLLRSGKGEGPAGVHVLDLLLNETSFSARMAAFIDSDTEEDWPKRRKPARTRRTLTKAEKKDRHETQTCEMLT